MYNESINFFLMYVYIAGEAWVKFNGDLNHSQCTSSYVHTYLLCGLWTHVIWLLTLQSSNFALMTGSLKLSAIYNTSCTAL